MGQNLACCVGKNPASQQNEDDLAALRSTSQQTVDGKVKSPSESQKKAASLLNDFNAHGDDVTGLTAAQLNKLSVNERFEKLFPFYRMDINGFSLRIKQAKKAYADRTGQTRYELIDEINISDLYAAFKAHDSWKDLSDPKSEFVKFLRLACTCNDKDEDGNAEKEEEHKEDDPHLDLFKLRLIGLLWCDGSPKEKAFEFYDMLQDTDQPQIAAADKDWFPSFQLLVSMATGFVFKYAPVFTKTGEENQNMSEEAVKEIINEESLQEKSEEFIDEIFGYESMLDRADWEEAVVKKMPWLLDPKEIRKKFEMSA